jgi:hypothetical protein
MQMNFDRAFGQIQDFRHKLIWMTLADQGSDLHFSCGQTVARHSPMTFRRVSTIPPVPIRRSPPAETTPGVGYYFSVKRHAAVDRSTHGLKKGPAAAFLFAGGKLRRFVATVRQSLSAKS